MLYVVRKRGLPRKFARFVLFRPSKKRFLNLLCVLDLFSERLQSTPFQIFFIFFICLSVYFIPVQVWLFFMFCTHCQRWLIIMNLFLTTPLHHIWRCESRFQRRDHSSVKQTNPIARSKCPAASTTAAQNRDCCSLRQHLQQQSRQLKGHVQSSTKLCTVRCAPYVRSRRLGSQSIFPSMSRTAAVCLGP